MASADGVGESFLSRVERVRSDIQTKFLRAHRVLQAREDDLLEELRRLADEYTGEGIMLQIKRLLSSKDALRDSLTENVNKEILHQLLPPINARIAELEIKLQKAKDTYKSVSLEWDVELDKRLSVAGEIRLNAVKEGIRDYKKIGDPIAAFGKHSDEGSSPGVFRNPNGIDINPVNNDIYICDAGNNRIQVYNKSFEFVFQFSEKMNVPNGICIKQNKIYVTQLRSHCLNVYSTEGKYLNSVGVKGKEELQFNSPAGLDVSTDKNRIYIAEYHNQRVQCLNLNLKFNSLIEDIRYAFDVKLTSDEIIVLSARNPCLSLYTYSHQLLREIPTGLGNPVLLPTFLTLDSSSNILITDLRAHCVCVYSFGGELMHRFGKHGEKRGDFIRPSGIAIDVEGRIIVASCNSDHCVQVF